MIEYLSATPGVEKVTPAGSLRRGRETVGDLDLLVTGRDPAPALDRFVALSARARSARSWREQGQRESRTRRHSGGRARAAGRKLWRRDAIFHRQQGSQCRASPASSEDGADAQRIRPVSHRDKRAVASANRRRDLRERWISPGFLRSCARIAARSKRPPNDRLPELVDASRYPRRPPHAHDRDRWSRDAGGDGGRGAGARLRIHCDHGSLEGAGDGERVG